MVFRQMRALPIDLHVTMSADTEHQVVLTCAAWPLPKMVPRCWKPADVGREYRAHQWMLLRAAQHRARNNKHVLSGKAFTEL